MIKIFANYEIDQSTKMFFKKTKIKNLWISDEQKKEAQHIIGNLWEISKKKDKKIYKNVLSSIKKKIKFFRFEVKMKTFVL